MYGHLRRGSSKFKDADTVRKEMLYGKAIEDFKLAYTTVIQDMRGSNPSLNYDSKLYIKAVDNVRAVQQSDKGCTNASFVEVVLSNYAKDAVVGMTLFASPRSVEIACLSGRATRIYRAARIVEQLDNITGLAHWMTKAQLLSWSESNNYSPITFYLFGLLISDQALIRAYEGAMGRDLGRTEKLDELIKLIPERQRKLYPNSLTSLTGQQPPA